MSDAQKNVHAGITFLVQVRGKSLPEKQMSRDISECRHKLFTKITMDGIKRNRGFS